MTQPPNERDIFQQVVLGDMTPRRMAGAMVSTPPSASVSRRWGTVDAITGDTLSINVGGIVIPGVRRVANYAPTVGETVMLDVVHGDLVVVNTLAPSPKNDIGSLSTRVTNTETTVSSHTSKLSNLPPKIISVKSQQLPEGQPPGWSVHTVTISGGQSMPNTDYVVNANASEFGGTQQYGASIFQVGESRAISTIAIELRIYSSWGAQLPCFVNYVLTATT